MLNKNNERELAYVVRVDNILPIEGADNVEVAQILGWTCMVRKGVFKVGDLAIYFEIDSKVPERPPFLFLAQKHFKIKTQKYFKGAVLSQGLLMSPKDFGWSVIDDTIVTEENERFVLNDGLTKRLEVAYSINEDNERKRKPVDKYRAMVQRYPDVFKKGYIKWLYNKSWGKKLLFLRYGKSINSFPKWVKVTDEERCQCEPYLFGKDTNVWMVTEKIDGTSTTFTIKRNKHFWQKPSFFVCSRRVCFDKPDKRCFYETNVYQEMAERYEMESVLNYMLKERPDLDYITIQGETYGDKIQKRSYGLKDHRFMAFNLIYGYKSGKEERLNPVKMKEALSLYQIPTVPIINTSFHLPDTVDKMLKYAEGKSKIDGEMREGVVLRTLDGVNSFKAVSNKYLLKYH